MCPRRGRESVSKWYCLVVVPQPIGFCILQKWANCSAWFIFPPFILHFLRRHWQNEASILQFICSRHAKVGRLMKTRPLATSRKIQKLIQQTFREDYRTNLHVSWNLHPGYTIIQWCMLLWILGPCFGMYDVMDACSVPLSEHLHYA